MMPIPRVSVEDDEEAYDHLRPYYDKQTPVILQSYARTWPAITKWKEWEYLRTRLSGGDDDEWHCDVEMGTYNNSSDNGEEGGRLSIPFGAYLDYLNLYREQQQAGDGGGGDMNDNPPILYLAQNDLPHALHSDIVLPSFLNPRPIDTTPPSRTTTAQPRKAATLGHGKLYQCMFWMGPPGAESPLHFDPLDNLLCQVVGTKHVVLLDRHAASHDVLQAGAAYGQQENTSALPMQSLLLSQSTTASSSSASLDDLDFMTGSLQPGDALYIPSKWWHYVSSTSTDFTISVNVWWR